MRRINPAFVLFFAGLSLVASAQAPPHRHTSHFVAHEVATGLRGGYQVVIEDLNRDKKPDLLAVASGLNELAWFENPTWTRHVLATGLDRPENAAAFDTDGDGVPEIGLVSGFTQSPATSSGIISVLTHQGDPLAPWSIKEIDRIPTAHRIRWADVDGNGKKVLVVAPLVGPKAEAPDFRDQTPLVFYRSGEWKRQPIATTEGLVHGLYAFDWNRHAREAIVTAGFSGVHVDELDKGKWQRSLLVGGDPAPWPKSGASDFTAVQLGSRRLFATIEPWHGNQIVVYRMDGGTWIRNIIDTEADLAHTIVAADLDATGKDVLVVADRGEKRSVYLYAASDDEGRRWTKETLDNAIQASGCVAADINADRKLDIACIGSATANLKWYENTRK